MSSKTFSVTSRRVRRVWVADVGVDANALETHLDRLRARSPDQIQNEEREAIARGVHQHLDAARATGVPMLRSARSRSRARGSWAGSSPRHWP